MLNIIREVFVPQKDYAGRDINLVISRLAAQTNTSAHVWSYIKEQKVYENTSNGMKIFPHEVSRNVA